MLDATRLLFDVCCLRAVKDLAVVFFLPDLPATLAAITEKSLFPEASVRGIKTLAGA